jgi:hypothetical protein
MKNFPLATYETRYWVDHAQFENVSSRIKDVMTRLFDAAKPQSTFSIFPNTPLPWPTFRTHQELSLHRSPFITEILSVTDVSELCGPTASNVLGLIGLIPRRKASDVSHPFFFEFVSDSNTRCPHPSLRAVPRSVHHPTVFSFKFGQAKGFQGRDTPNHIEPPSSHPGMRAILRSR